MDYHFSLNVVPVDSLQSLAGDVQRSLAQECLEGSPAVRSRVPRGELGLPRRESAQRLCALAHRRGGVERKDRCRNKRQR